MVHRIVFYINAGKIVAKAGTEPHGVYLTLEQLLRDVYGSMPIKEDVPELSRQLIAEGSGQWEDDEDGWWYLMELTSTIST